MFSVRTGGSRAGGGRARETYLFLCNNGLYRFETPHGSPIVALTVQESASRLGKPGLPLHNLKLRPVSHGPGPLLTTKRKRKLQDHQSHPDQTSLKRTKLSRETKAVIHELTSNEATTKTDDTGQVPLTFVADNGVNGASIVQTSVSEPIFQVTLTPVTSSTTMAATSTVPSESAAVPDNEASSMTAAAPSSSTVLVPVTDTQNDAHGVADDALFWHASLDNDFFDERLVSGFLF